MSDDYLTFKWWGNTFSLSHEGDEPFLRAWLSSDEFEIAGTFKLRIDHVSWDAIKDRPIVHLCPNTPPTIET